MNKTEPVKIQMYPSTKRLHTAYKTLVSDPPKGYVFIGPEESKKREFIEKLKKLKLIRTLYHSFISVFKTTSLLEAVDNVSILPETDLIFSTGSLYRGNKLWILDIIDHVYCLAGNNYYLFKSNKDKIESILKRENCKKIICAHESVLRDFKANFPLLSQKTVLIRPAVKPANYKKNLEKYKKKSGFQILFMGSINNPDDFYMKGGYEAIAAFEKLPVKYCANLIIRCKIPEDIKRRVSLNPQIKIIDQQLPYEEIIDLYVNSDIFLYPGHTYALMVFLESMYFGLPIVTINTYATEDYIKNNINGIVVNKSQRLSAYSAEDYPNNLRSKEFAKEVKNIENLDINYIMSLTDAIESLIKNPSLRKKLSDNSQIIAGKNFSIKARNKQFKEVFNEIIS